MDTQKSSFESIDYGLETKWTRTRVGEKYGVGEYHNDGLQGHRIVPLELFELELEYRVPIKAGGA